MSTPTILNLTELRDGSTFTPAFGECLAQAAAVCLENQNHETGSIIAVVGTFNGSFLVCWEPVTDSHRRCWNDLQYATEHGAYGIAILLLKRLTGLQVIEKSRKGTGFDFWIGHSSNFLFQGTFRLEVSGLLNGDDSAIKARENRKKVQVSRFETLELAALRAYIAIVEFGQPKSRISEK